jgi:Cullin family.
MLISTVNSHILFLICSLQFSSSYPKVKAKCEQHMVADHLNFLQGECVPMVAEERRHDLANMYPLLRSVREGINILIDAVRDHICKQGLEAISGLSGDNVSISVFSSKLCLVPMQIQSFASVKKLKHSIIFQKLNLHFPGRISS